LPAGAVDGAEAYLTDPHFNRGLVTLTPSMIIAAIPSEAVFKSWGPPIPKPQSKG